MNKPMNHTEIIEAEEIHREDALLRIAELIKRYGVALADFVAALPDWTTVSVNGRMDLAREAVPGTFSAAIIYP